MRNTGMCRVENKKRKRESGIWNFREDRRKIKKGNSESGIRNLGFQGSRAENKKRNPESGIRECGIPGVETSFRETEDADGRNHPAVH